MLAKTIPSSGEALPAIGIGTYKGFDLAGSTDNRTRLAEVVRRVKANIDHYDPRKLGVGTVGTLRTTGPIAYSLAIEAMLHLRDHRLADIADLGLRYSIFEPFGSEHRGHIGSTYARAQEPVAQLSPVISALYLAHRAKRKLRHVLGRARPAVTVPTG